MKPTPVQFRILRRVVNGEEDFTPEMREKWVFGLWGDWTAVAPLVTWAGCSARRCKSFAEAEAIIQQEITQPGHYNCVDVVWMAEGVKVTA